MIRRSRKHPTPDPTPVTEREVVDLTADLRDAHEESLPTLRAALAEWREGSADVQAGVARLVSTPSSRRAFLLGGGAILGGVALASSGVGRGVAAAATRGTAPGGTRSAFAAARAQNLTGDLAVVGLAASLENLAVGTYQAAIDAAGKGALGAVPPAVVTFAQTAQQQHRDHAAAWNGVLTQAGKQPVSGVDLTVKASVDEAFAKVTDVPGLARLALDLENGAAATYLAAIGAVKSPAGIKTAASIQPVEMQHAAILHFLLGEYPVPDSFATKRGARTVGDKVG